jgi:microcystin-dependent protein
MSGKSQRNVLSKKETQMKTFDASICQENTALASYTGKRYSDTLTKVTFEQLASQTKNTAKALKVLYKVFTGRDPKAEDVAISIKAKNHAFSDFYGPTLCKNEKGLLIYFGDETIPFTTKRGKLEVDLPETIEVKLSFETVKFNGFDETVFKVTIFMEESETLLTFCLPVRLAPDSSGEKKIKDLKEEFTPDVLQTLLERKPGELIKAIGEVPQFNGFDGPLLKLSQLEEGEIYSIIGYRGAKPSGRQTFILRLLGNLDEEQKPTQTYEVEQNGEIKEAPLTEAEVWANSSMFNFFNNKPAITSENPAELLIRGKKETKRGVSVDAAIIFDSPDTVAVEEDNLDFDFV